VEGGALALGHPWGASGAVLLVRLFSQLVRRGGGRYGGARFGLAAIAAGGGQGVAAVVEACA
jgi:acetyl-CoA C-acetyltransferase